MGKRGFEKRFDEGIELGRTELGEAAFEAAFARGQNLSAEEKILYCQEALGAVV